MTLNDIRKLSKNYNELLGEVIKRKGEATGKSFIHTIYLYNKDYLLPIFNDQ